MDKKEPQTVTMDQLEALVVSEEYLRPTLAPTLTICILLLANGFSVRGESACADPAAFDEELGRKYARRDAVQKIWPLEGYLLRQRLHDEAETSCATSANGRYVPSDMEVRNEAMRLAINGTDANASISITVERAKEIFKFLKGDEAQDL